MQWVHNHINYIEFQAHDLSAIKEFYTSVFGWTFVDYGPDYCSFSESGVQGGFAKTNTVIVNGALIVLYHSDLKSVKNKIIRSGGKITKDVFSFPGGQRFHFKDPDGNELAVWSDK